MALSDPQVAALAQQAATLIPNEAEVWIAPAAADDPYRWGTHSWTVHFDVGTAPDDSIVVWLSADNSPTRALHRLVDGLRDLSETTRYRGVALPRCRPGHAHAARADLADHDVVLRCPETNEQIERLRPDDVM